MNAARHTRTLSWLLIGLMAASPAWALYKVVGPDGKVTYTDRPPVDAKAQSVKGASSAGPSTDGLPFELARVVSRYPVVLMTSANCSACESARQLLKARGVPFVEKTVSTAEDAQALSRQEGTDQVPVARIGSKQLLGFSSGEWTSYLDAAGFPEKSMLPANYRYPAAVPLVATTAKNDAADKARKAPPAATERSDPAPTEGRAPAGIRF